MLLHQGKKGIVLAGVAIGGVSALVVWAALRAPERSEAAIPEFVPKAQRPAIHRIEASWGAVPFRPAHSIEPADLRSGVVDPDHLLTDAMADSLVATVAAHIAARASGRRDRKSVV